MKCTYSDIEDVDADTTHVLLGGHTQILCCPLGGSDARVLDFVEVLHTLDNVYEQVGATSGIGTETPDLPCIDDTVTGVNDTSLDCLGEFLIERHCLGVETAVFILRLGRGRGLSLDDRRVVAIDGVRCLERNTSAVFLEILQ